MNLLEQLRKDFAHALSGLTDRPTEFARQVREAQEAKFGDYQANFAMALAKELKSNPRAVAQEIIDRLPDQSMFASIGIAGPGFINMRLSEDFLRTALSRLLVDRRVGLEPIATPRTLVIDYSSPNVAKPMHVGHLRSTIIGDSIARIYRALGWNVIADNHLGDWGTQFGMLIYGWRHLRDPVKADENPLGELARLYPLVNQLSESDPAIARAVRDETVKLHQGDSENLALWNSFMPWCLADLEKTYQRLDIVFDIQHGESFYQPMLEETVAQLQSMGLAVESDGAICIFFPDPSGKTDAEGKPVQRFAPAIIRKADGAFTYATSDLACIRYRAATYHPDLIVYVVDDRQSLHFEQLFDAAKRANLAGAELVHVAFGKMLGHDGRPYKTREGAVFGLEALLDEAVARARTVVDKESRELAESDRQEIAEVVGIGAVKYGDLCQNRTSDYVFDLDKMVQMNGNTATYLQYAYARNRSIFRKGGVDAAELAASNPALFLSNPAERALAMSLLRFPEAVAQAAADFKPNLLANYLFSLANEYAGFYRDCAVLGAENNELRQSRLALCELTTRTLREGLRLLGIRTVERM